VHCPANHSPVTPELPPRPNPDHLKPRPSHHRPCKARALAQSLWDGEEYYLQVRRQESERDPSDTRDESTATRLTHVPRTLAAGRAHAVRSRLGHTADTLAGRRRAYEPQGGAVHLPPGVRRPSLNPFNLGLLSEGSSLSPGKRLHHQRSSRHAMVPLSDTSPHPEG
jgi:hypothetical protein